MISSLRKLAERLENPPLWRVTIGLFIVVAIAFTVFPFVRFLRSGTQMDYRTWFDAAQSVLQHRELYPQSSAFPFMYPPTCAVLLSFAAIFGKPLMILLLALLNTAAWIFCIKFSVALSGNRSRKFVRAAMVVSNLVVLVFIWSSYHLGQPSLILLALMLGAFICLDCNRQVFAGSLIALATAIKAFPILALCYLLYRRYWIAAVSLGLALCILLFLLPLPFRGWHQTVTDFHDWERGMLRYQAGGIAQRPARSYSWKNQSAWGLANRLLRHVSAEDEGKPAIYVNFVDLPFSVVNDFITLAALVFGISFVTIMPWSRRRRTNVLEFAALLILILIFTPLAFGYLFSWLMLPLAILTQEVLTREQAGSVWLWLISAVLLLALTGLAPRLAQSYGSVFLAGIALYCGIACELAWEKRQPV